MGKNLVDASDVVAKLLEDYKPEFFNTENADPCIRIAEEKCTRTFRLNTREWADWLVTYIRVNSWRANDNRRKEIQAELISMTSGSKPQKLYVRVAPSDAHIFIDLNDDTFEAVKIGNGKFTISQPDGVNFYRASKQLALPRPKKVRLESFLTKFQSLMPTQNDEWLLILAFILKCLHRDHGGYLFLVIEGGQGTGKSTLSKRLKRLIDPSDPAFLSPVTKPDDIIVASFHSFLLAYDNISGIDYSTADFMCRLSTGGGISKRAHYANHDEMVYSLHRPCIFNGIGEQTNRPDLLDRCVVIELGRIEESFRIAESELDKTFEEDLPQLLGGIYQLMADCLDFLPKVRTSDLPRMTDYARMGIALESVLSLKENSFLDAYASNRREQSENAFWTDELCSAVHKYLSNPSNGLRPLVGSAQELIAKVFCRGRERGTPRFTPRSFSTRLRRVEPILLTKGILVERLTRSASARTIEIRWVNPPDHPINSKQKISSAIQEGHEIYDL